MNEMRKHYPDDTDQRLRTQGNFKYCQAYFDIDIEDIWLKTNFRSFGVVIGFEV